MRTFIIDYREWLPSVRGAFHYSQQDIIYMVTADEYELYDYYIQGLKQSFVAEDRNTRDYLIWKKVSSILNITLA